jgi:hypothetical protein
MSKQSRAEYLRQYRLTHQESIANQKSQYRLAHQESIANQKSQYRVDHAANIEKSNASYYSKRKQQKLSQGSNDTLNESFFSDLTDSRNNSFAHSGSGLFAVDDSDDASLEPNHGLLFLLGDELSAITPYDMSQPSRAGDVPLEKRLLDSNLKDARKLPAKSATKLAKDAEIKQRGEDRAQLVEALAMACNGEVPSVAFDKQPSIRNAAKDFVDRVYGIVLHTCGVCSERRYLDAGHMDVTGVFTCRRCQYWGTNFMLDYLPIHPNQRVQVIEVEDDHPLNSKGFFMWNQDQETQGTFKLSIFLSNQNADNLADSFVLHDFLLRMKDVKEGRLNTHSFAYGRSHYYNVSDVVNDALLSIATDAALEQCARHTQLYLNKFHSWADFGVGGSPEQAAKELAIMSLMFNTYSFVNNANLVSALVPISM